MKYLTQPVNRLLLHRSLYSPHFTTKSFENVDMLMVAMETVKGFYPLIYFLRCVLNPNADFTLKRDVLFLYQIPKNVAGLFGSLSS